MGFNRQVTNCVILTGTQIPSGSYAPGTMFYNKDTNNLYIAEGAGVFSGVHIDTITFVSASLSIPAEFGMSVESSYSADYSNVDINIPAEFGMSVESLYSADYSNVDINIPAEFGMSVTSAYTQEQHPVSIKLYYNIDVVYSHT